MLIYEELQQYMGHKCGPYSAIMQTFLGSAGKAVHILNLSISLN